MGLSGLTSRRPVSTKRGNKSVLPHRSGLSRRPVAPRCGRMSGRLFRRSEATDIDLRSSGGNWIVFSSSLRSAPGSSPSKNTQAMNGDIDSAEQVGTTAFVDSSCRRRTRYIKLVGQSAFRPGARQIKGLLLRLIFLFAISSGRWKPRSCAYTRPTSPANDEHVAAILFRSSHVGSGSLHARRILRRRPIP